MPLPTWPQMIIDLRKVGFTFQRLGDTLGISKGATHDLMTGRSKQPTGDVAVKLIDLHRKNRRKINARHND